MSDKTEALARVLDPHAFKGGPGGVTLRRDDARVAAERILADPGPLLEALAEAGIIHPQLCSRSGAACFNGWSGDG